MRVLGTMALAVMLSACSAASDLGSSEAAPLPFDDAPATTQAETATTGRSASTAVVPTASAAESTATTITTETSENADASTTTTEGEASSVTEAPTTSQQLGPTIPVVDPNAAVCEASIAVAELGTLVTPDEAEAVEDYFTRQATVWADVATAAPASIAGEAETVATFAADVRDLLSDNGWNLFAVVLEATELEASSGADHSRTLVGQFLDGGCAFEPPTPERATAAFYIELLGTNDDRLVLADILAAAEVFSLEGATCFVERVTPDAIHPLVDAPATPGQEIALTTVLNTCQLSIGT